MINRDNVLSKAVNDCFEELYTLVVPKITWEEFKEECKIYSNKYKAWEEYKRLLIKREKENLSEEELKRFSVFPINWENKSITECIGPSPYEFYFLPKEIMKDICDSYVHAYKIDNQQELLDTIETLKNYCKEPIVDKYIDDWTDETGFHHPGYRSYDHPDNLEKELEKILHNTSTARLIQEKFFEFLDMAGNFFSWNRDLNSFNTSVYLGPSPNSNKEAVIENWKKYRNKDITINDYIEED
jgi:hypothetical protein